MAEEVARGEHQTLIQLWSYQAKAGYLLIMAMLCIDLFGTCMPPGSYSGEMLNVAKNEKFAKSLVSKGTWKSKTTFTESQNVQGLKVHLEVQRPCSSRATQSRHLCNLLLSNKD